MIKTWDVSEAWKSLGQKKMRECLLETGTGRRIHWCFFEPSNVVLFFLPKKLLSLPSEHPKTWHHREGTKRPPLEGLGPCFGISFEERLMSFAFRKGQDKGKAVLDRTWFLCFAVGQVPLRVPFWGLLDSYSFSKAFGGVPLRALTK